MVGQGGLGLPHGMARAQLLRLDDKMEDIAGKSTIQMTAHLPVFFADHDVDLAVGHNMPGQIHHVLNDRLVTQVFQQPGRVRLVCAGACGQYQRFHVSFPSISISILYLNPLFQSSRGDAFDDVALGEDVDDQQGQNGDHRARKQADSTGRQIHPGRW